MEIASSYAGPLGRACEHLHQAVESEGLATTEGRTLLDDSVSASLDQVSSPSNEQATSPEKVETPRTMVNKPTSHGEGCDEGDNNVVALQHPLEENQDKEITQPGSTCNPILISDSPFVATLGQDHMDFDCNPQTSAGADSDIREFCGEKPTPRSVLSEIRSCSNMLTYRATYK